MPTSLAINADACPAAALCRSLSRAGHPGRQDSRWDVDTTLEMQATLVIL